MQPKRGGEARLTSTPASNIAVKSGSTQQQVKGVGAPACRTKNFGNKASRSATGGEGSLTHLPAIMTPPICNDRKSVVSRDRTNARHKRQHAKRQVSRASTNQSLVSQSIRDFDDQLGAVKDLVAELKQTVPENEPKVGGNKSTIQDNKVVEQPAGKAPTKVEPPMNLLIARTLLQTEWRLYGMLQNVRKPQHRLITHGCMLAELDHTTSIATATNCPEIRLFLPSLYNLDGFRHPDLDAVVSIGPAYEKPEEPPARSYTSAEVWDGAAGNPVSVIVKGVEITRTLQEERKEMPDSDDLITTLTDECKRPRTTKALSRFNAYLHKYGKKPQSCHKCGHIGMTMCDCHIPKKQKPGEKIGEVEQTKWFGLWHRSYDPENLLNRNCEGMSNTMITDDKLNIKLYTYIIANLQPEYPDRSLKMAHAHKLRLKYYESENIKPSDAVEVKRDLLTQARAVDQIDLDFLTQKTQIALKRGFIPALVRLFRKRED